MKKIELVKKAGRIITSLGVDAIAFNIIKATLPPQMHIATKICTWVAGGVLSSLIAKKAEAHVDVVVDSLISDVKEIVEEVKKEAKAV